MSPHKHLPHLSSFTSQPLVFFTVTTHQRRRCLDNDVAHRTLRGIWERSADHDGWYVGDYMLMPDHVHFFARAAVRSITTAQWMKMWKSVSSRELSASLNIAGPVWQSDYFDRFLRESESYREKWQYVQSNPVRAGLVSRAEDWAYQGRIHALGF